MWLLKAINIIVSNPNQAEGMIKLEDVNEIIGGHGFVVTFVPPKVQ